MAENQIQFDQVGCARCDGEGHPGLIFYKFERPPVVGDATFEYWAFCPATGEPILMQVMDAPDD